MNLRSTPGRALPPSAMVALAACLALAAAAHAHAPTAPPSPAASPSTQPSTSTGRVVVTSDDGSLTASLSAGDTPELTISALPNAQHALLPRRTQNLRAAFAYQVQPDGAQLGEPITIQYTVAVPSAKPDPTSPGVPMLLLAVRSSGDTWEWLADQAMQLDETNLTLSGTTTHLGVVAGFRSPRVDVSPFRGPTTAFVGEGIDWVITFDGLAVRGYEPGRPEITLVSSIVILASPRPVPRSSRPGRSSFTSRARRPGADGSKRGCVSATSGACQTCRAET